MTRRWLQRSKAGATINLAVMLASLGVLCIVVNYFAQQPSLRGQFDATKTRAYSLTPQTHQLLSSLEGSWTIAVILDERRAERAMLRQIDEVLRRYTDASPRISVLRINPADPLTLGRYESLLADLHATYAEQIQQYDYALDDGVKAFRELQMFAIAQSTALEPVLRGLTESTPQAEQLSQLALVLGRLADQGDVVVNEIAKARRTDDARPIADYETARSILAQALSDYATQLDEVSRLLDRWRGDAGTVDAVRQYAVSAVQPYAHIAQQLAVAADPLKHLLPMELSAIGQQLAVGEAAVVLSPRRAAVIPAAQLFPKFNFRQHDDGGIRFDQRFRGEQLISATIRSLLVDQMPLVVFVHGEDGSMFLQRQGNEDLVAAAAMLRSARFEVREWAVASRQAQRPEPRPRQSAVWVVVPSANRKGLEVSPSERSLLQAAKTLIDEHQPVLLNLYPSMLPRYGQPDPWAALAAGLGVNADTSSIVVERNRLPNGTFEVQRAVALQEFASEHAVARAIEGLQGYFAVPVPIKPAGTAGRDLTVESLLQIPPAGAGDNRETDRLRWIESNWSADTSALEQPNESQRIEKPVTFAAAITRRAESKGSDSPSDTRSMVMGSGGWMLTYAADRITDIGGGRVALTFPANHEFLLASVAWLSGHEQLIAASPLSQELSRLQDLSPESRTRWFFVLAVAMPAVCIGVAFGVSMWRRR